MTTTFVLGQRVRTTVDAPAGWPGALAAPAGSLGTITRIPGAYSGYAVLLDDDPDQMAALYDSNELTPA